MIILSFTLQCLFLFAEVLLCSEELADCGHPIKIYKDYECVHRFEDFESHVRVYRNATLIRDMEERHGRKPSGKASARLVAYPLLIAESPRYRADFHIEIPYQDLVNVETILLVFSTREGCKEVRRAAVVQRVTKLDKSDGERYVTAGCYWHYNFFLATCEITVTVGLTLLRKDDSQSYAKYYFRIPFWEQFNNVNNIHPCMFAPFAYVEVLPNMEVVSVRSVNCSLPGFVGVEQRMESTGEVLKTEVIYTDEFGRGNTSLTPVETLHYYEAVVSENALDKIVADEGRHSNVIIFISVLIPVLCIVMILVLRCLREPVFPPRNSILFLREKPRVKFVYSKDSKFHVYRAQTEILMLFMEKYCNVTIADDSADFQEPSKTTPLLNDCDTIIHVPFPTADSGVTLTTWKRTRDCIILVLPFWSGNQPELDGLRRRFPKWKQFTLMDEFFSMLTYIQRTRTFRQRRCLSPITVDGMMRKLEDCSLTNEGFLFCLEEATSRAGGTPACVSLPVGFPKLQDMEL